MEAAHDGGCHEGELYDIAADALEATDVAAEKPEVVKDLLAKIEAWRATLPEKPTGDVFSAERAGL